MVYILLCIDDCCGPNSFVSEALFIVHGCSWASIPFYRPMIDRIMCPFLQGNIGILLVVVHLLAFLIYLHLVFTSLGPIPMSGLSWIVHLLIMTGCYTIPTVLRRSFLLGYQTTLNALFLSVCPHLLVRPHGVSLICG